MPDIQNDYSGIILSDINATTGAKTFEVSEPLYNATGVLKIGNGTDHEEWFEVTASQHAVVPYTITTGLRGLSKTVTSTLTEDANERSSHAAGEVCELVVYPNTIHPQNTDTGTTSTTFTIDSAGNFVRFTSAGQTGDHTFTLPDATSTLAALGVAQTWTGVQTFTTPILGVATATSINKVTITQPATGATLTIDDGFTLHATGNVTALSGSHTGTSSGTNTGDITLAGTPDYITLAGQVLTRTKLDLVDDLNTFSSANLATNLTDETGTGVVVFNNAPTITSPVVNTGISGTAIVTGVGGSGSNTLIMSEKKVYDVVAAATAGVSTINGESGSISLTGGDYITATTTASAVDFNFDFGDVWLLSQIFS